MQLCAAPLYGIATAVLVGIVLAFSFGGLSPRIAGGALAAGAAVAAFAAWQARLDQRHPRRLGAWEWGALMLFTLFALRAFLWLIFRDGDAVKVLSPNNLGDMSLHITYIEFLANGARFWPDNPIFTGGKLTYPLGADLFNALLCLIGVDLFRGLIWAGLIGSAVTLAALWKWGGAFTVTGFLCNGGTAGFAAVWLWTLADYQSEMDWKSIPLALFVTQRGLLFALPAGLLLLASWRARFFHSGGGEREAGSRLPFWGEALLYAAMPIFHLHTFLFLSFLLATWFLAAPEARRELAKLVGVAFLPATALVLLETDFFRGPSVISLHLGWMQNEEAVTLECQKLFGAAAPWIQPAYFWFTNFGVLPLLVGALGVRLLTAAPERNDSLAFVLPAVAVFFICCVVKFAPWEWDNTKLMIWAYLAVLPFLWRDLLAGWPLWVRSTACAALFFSGFVSLLGGIGRSHTGHEITRSSELDGVAKAVAEIPVEARFVGWPTFNHPLLLVGRKMALGYTGHVWSHGLAWSEPAGKVEALLSGVPEWRELAAELDVQFLFWGHEEEAALPNSTQPWTVDAKLVAAGEWGALYDLTAPTPVAPAEPSQDDDPAPSPNRARENAPALPQQ